MFRCTGSRTPRLARTEYGQSHAGDTASVSMNPIRTKSNTKSQLTRQCECPEGRREVCYTCNCTFTESIGIEGVGRSVWMNEMRIACWKSRNETTCARMGVHENMHENVC